MNKKEYLDLFLHCDAFPKFLLLSDYHRFFSAGKATCFDPNQSIYAPLFFGARCFGEWEAFAPYERYSPAVVYLDDQRHDLEGSAIGFNQKIEKRENFFVSFDHHIEYDTWARLVEKAKHSLLDKVVLARKTTMKATNVISPEKALFSLLDKEGSLFAFWIDPDHLFLGLTPEHLLVKNGESLYTEALAGTRKRGNTLENDLALKEDLLSSKKDMEEFQYVCDYIHASLKSFSSNIEISSTQVKQTPNVQHLNKKYHALVDPHLDIEKFIQVFHPTPAMLGVPKQEAFEWLKEHESFDRGLYSSTLGWQMGRQSELVVGIRSALITNKEMNLYAGLGIVKGSDPQKEWQELNDKLLLMVKAFESEYCKI